MNVQDTQQVSPAIRRTMQANRSRDTSPELAVRSLIHGAGLRYRVCPPLPFDRRRRADFVFTRVGLYIFIDGCFWHGCPEHFQMPKSNADFWIKKITANKRRDRDSESRLSDLGFTVLRFWEHEDPNSVAAEIKRTYSALLVGGND